MTKGAKLLVLALAILCGGCLYGIIGFAGALDGLCGEDVTAEETSPDGQLRAVVYTAGCGAAGSSSYGFSVLWANEALEYAAPHNALHTQYDEPIAVEWRGSDTLDVTVPGRVLTGDLTHLVVRRVYGVDVIYHDPPDPE